MKVAGAVPVRLVVGAPTSEVRLWEIWRFDRGGRARLVASFQGDAPAALLALEQATDAYPGERVRLQTDIKGEIKC